MAPFLVNMIAVCAGGHLRGAETEWWQVALHNGPSVTVSKNSVRDTQTSADSSTSSRASSVSEQLSSKKQSRSRTGTQPNADGSATQTAIQTATQERSSRNREESNTSEDTLDRLRSREQQVIDSDGQVVTDPQTGEEVLVTQFDEQTRSQVQTLSENNSTASNASLSQQENSTTLSDVLRTEGVDDQGLAVVDEQVREQEEKSTVEDAAVSESSDSTRVAERVQEESQSSGVTLEAFSWDSFDDFGFNDFSFTAESTRALAPALPRALAPSWTVRWRRLRVDWRLPWTVRWRR